MKNLLRLLILLFFSAGMEAAAQEPSDDKVFTYVEQMPEFNGNIPEWLAKNVVYPAKSRKRNEQGKAVLQFVITKTGAVTDVVVIKSSGYKLLDKEAVRVVKTMQPWKPGKQNGKVVNVRYTLPLVFKLN